MSENSYEKGRLNLPFVGFCTFAKSPIAEDWDNIKADVAFMGAPYDCGTQWRSGARMGPRSIREASTLFSFGHGGAYSYEDDTMYLQGVSIVDMGDADMIHTNTEQSHANIEYSCMIARCRLSTSVYAGFGGICDDDTRPFHVSPDMWDSIKQASYSEHINLNLKNDLEF